MRVAALTTLFPDSTRPTYGVFVEQSLVRLSSQPGVELTIVAPLGLPPWPLSRHPRYRALAALPREETWKGLRVLRPRFPLVPGIGWRINPALIARACVPLLRSVRPDVIQGDFLFPCGVAAASAGKRLGVPVLLKGRGSDVHYWGARAQGAIVRACEGAARVLAVSAALKADLEALGVPEAKIAVHYTGVDLDRFCPAPDRAAARAALGLPAPLVVSVGALIPLKGHDVLIRAVASLPGVHLRIAGRGPEEAALSALIAELGATGRIALLGPLPHAEVASLLAAADVFALASEREGLANAWVEALACGTPVVATRVGGAPEVIDCPAAGRLAERTPPAFASAIAELLADPIPPAEVRASVEGRFSWDRHATELAAHLREIAAQPISAR